MVERLITEEIELLKTIANTEPDDPSYGKMVSNLQKLQSIKQSEQNANFEHEFKSKQQKIEETEKQRRYDLDAEIRRGQLKNEERKIDSEIKLNNIDAAAKVAEMELNILKFDHDKDLSIKRFEQEVALNKSAIAETKSHIEQSTGLWTKVKDTGFLVGGLILGGATIFAEDVRIISTKPLDVANKIRSLTKK